MVGWAVPIGVWQRPHLHLPQRSHKGSLHITLNKVLDVECIISFESLLDAYTGFPTFIEVMFVHRMCLARPMFTCTRLWV